MELEQEGIFLGLIKMSLIQENRKEARMQDLNSNSFEFNWNGFELGLDKRKVQKMFEFLGELRKMMKELLDKVSGQEVR